MLKAILKPRKYLDLDQEIVPDPTWSKSSGSGSRFTTLAIRMAQYYLKISLIGTILRLTFTDSGLPLS
jgi:hypothetical protein